MTQKSKRQAQYATKRREHNVKYTIAVTESVVQSAKENTISAYFILFDSIGSFINVDVVQGGYVIPIAPIVHETRNEAVRAAAVHNKFVGYSEDEVNDIVSRSMFGIK